MADSNGRTIEEAIHERWARMTDNGRLDSRVADLERACDDFFERCRALYNPTESAADHFRLFRALAVADLKSDIVLHPRPSAHVTAQAGDGVYSGPKYW